MILFDLLKVSDDGKRLYINFHINEAAYFKDLTLESMTILTADKVSETDPLTPTAEYIYKVEFEDGLRDYTTVLQPVDMNELFTKSNFFSDLFFVYVKVKGTPDPCTPCGLDEQTTLGVTFDENLLHQRVLGYTNELVHDCQVPVGFTDFILLWQAFKSSIEAEHPIMAIKYWNMLFDDYSAVTQAYNTGCGCHGKNSL
jgi:hypothetical protein